MTFNDNQLVLEALWDTVVDIEETQHELYLERAGYGNDEYAEIQDRLSEAAENLSSAGRQLSQLGARFHHYGSFRSYCVTGDEWEN